MSDTNTKRVISGAVLVVLLILADVFGGLILLAACCALSVLGMREYFAACSMQDSLLLKLCLGCTAIHYIGVVYLGTDFLAASVFLGFLVLAGAAVLKYPEYSLQEVSVAFLGYVYTGLLMSILFLIRGMDQGILLFALVFLCSWLGDTFGYAIGRRFGKHKMTPVLSPKKSVEGLAAELIGVTLVSLIFGLVFKGKLSAYNYPVLLCVLSGICGSMISVFGDLFASAIKREYGIKDYSNLIPGHGGILDRFDSVLFTAPFVYFLFFFCN